MDAGRVAALRRRRSVLPLGLGQEMEREASHGPCDCCTRYTKRRIHPRGQANQWCSPLGLAELESVEKNTIGCEQHHIGTQSRKAFSDWQKKCGRYLPQAGRQGLKLQSDVIAVELDADPVRS